MADPITDALTNAATAGIKRASGDAGSVEQFDLTQLIAADKYLTTKAAVGNGSAWGAVRLARVVPPGAIGGRNP